MSVLIIIGFGLSMALSLGAAVYFYGHGIAARNSALILARVATNENNAYSDLQSSGIPATRLAADVRMQNWLTDVPLVANIAEVLEQSGRPTTVAQVVAYIAVSTVVTGGMAYKAGCHPPAAMFVGLIAGTAPIFYYQHLGAKRTTAFEAQLPQALELISLYLRSGRSLPQAFLATADEIESPAAEEFAVCAEAYRLGRPLDVTLKGLAVKYESLVGIRLFAVAVSVLAQTGGNLVEVLERIRRTLDAGIVYTLKLRAMTGEARMSANILGAVPGLFMTVTALVSPAHFNDFFESTLGLVLFGLFLVLWASGLVWVRAMMSSKA
jgi:tight adherence protein B